MSEDPREASVHVTGNMAPGRYNDRARARSLMVYNPLVVSRRALWR